MFDNKDLENIIVGRNAVSEALRSGKRTIDQILINKNINHNSIISIISRAKEMGIPIKKCDSKKLDSMSSKTPHQGIIAIVSECNYSNLDDIFNLAKEKGQPLFVVILDEIQDPHNMGAIIRSAECAGAHGVIIPKRRSSGLTYAVSKASAGAIEHIPIVRVGNISGTIDLLKKQGVWVYGADMDGEVWCKSDLSGSVAVVVGNEGRGISRLVKEKCDYLLSLPMFGHISSLNASVAAGIIMYEVARQRNNIKSFDCGR